MVAPMVGSGGLRDWRETVDRSQTVGFVSVRRQGPGFSRKNIFQHLI
jgi:hypothetical protein